jgi:hypothetical protein
MEELRPASLPPLPPELDQVCDRFEQGWRAALAGSPRPRLEEFLAGAAGPQRQHLLRELLLVEIGYRCRLGEKPSPEEYQRRFPEMPAAWLARELTPPSPPTVVQEVPFDDGQTLSQSPGLQPAADPPAKAGPGMVIEGYEVLKELGRGGMGVVYQARHVRLNRVVALKMILAGGHAGEQDLLRFLGEAEAVAALQHAHVVQLYDFGQHDGLPFFTLEFVGGGSLADKLKDTPLPPREAAGLVEQLARGMAYAHGHGIVHRDLKPANVLLTEDGTPKLTDFGLAKRVEVGSGLTVSGAIIGTPSYMAPEQAGGDAKRVGPAADVYALGAVLYECLTGRPPFRAAAVMETLLQVIRDEPVPVRQLQPGVPRDLETVCHKCLQKEPARRYTGALELAEDLRRFQAGEPIAARPVGRLERGWRWCRRHPAVASLSAALLLLVGVAAGASVAALRFYEMAEGERKARDAAATLAASEADAHKDASKARDEALATGKELRRHLSFQYVANGTRALDQDDYGLALLWYARALEIDEGDAEREPADQLRLANTWRLLPRLVGLYRHQGPLTWAEMNAAGDRVVTSSYDGTARLWDVASGRQLGQDMTHGGFYVFRARFSPDGKQIATAGGDGTVRLWDGGTARPLGAPLEMAAGVSVLAFSPDGKKLAAGCFNPAQYWLPPQGVEPNDPRRVVNPWLGGAERPLVALWDLDTRKGRALPQKQRREHVTAVAFSADSRRVAYADSAQSVTLCDTATGAVTAGPFAASSYVTHLALDRDAGRLIVGTFQNTSDVWNVKSGQKLSSALSGTGAFFTPDGKQMIYQAGTWDFAQGKLVRPAPHDAGPPSAVDFGDQSGTAVRGTGG